MVLLSTITGSAPTDIAAWMACAFFAIGLWNALNKAIDRNRTKPEPSTTYPTKQELEKHVTENRSQHANLFTKIGEVERRLQLELKQDTGALHEKVNKVDSTTTGLKTMTDLQNQHLLRIEAKLDSMNRDSIQDRKRHP
jgi:hypothetical protein